MQLCNASGIEPLIGSTRRNSRGLSLGVASSFTKAKAPGAAFEALIDPHCRISWCRE